MNIWDIIFGEEKFEEGFQIGKSPALFSYSDPKVKRVVFALKRGSCTAAKIIAKHMEHHIPKGSVIIPIPSSRKRGFNQCVLIAKYLPYPYQQVIHRLSTDTQKSLNRAARLENKLWTSLSESMKQHTFVIIDDVTTTGATLREAKRVLHEAGVENVTVLAFAH